MDIPWDDVRLFLAVAEAGSFSGAARSLRLGQPTLSRRMGELEELIDAPLFVRATDGVSLTSAGERLLPLAQRMAEWAAEAGSALELGRKAGPSGKVRLAAPPGVAFDLLAPFAAWLRTRAPKIHLEILANVEYVNLMRGEADLAVRIRPPSESDLVCLAEMKVDVGVFAAESYARKLPPRYGLSDLDWIAWARPYTDLPPNPQLAAAIEGFEPVFASNDYLVQLAALEAGVGCMVFGRPLPHQARWRTLRELDVSLGPQKSASFFLVGAKRLMEAPRIKRVAEYLKTYLEGKK